MMPDDKKFFDVSKPRPSGPWPTSKPVITNYPAPGQDPMISRSPSMPPGRTNTDNVPPTMAGPVQLPPASSSSSMPPERSEPPRVEATPPSAEELHVPAGQQPTVKHKPRLWAWILVLLIILVGIYAAIDAKTNLNLPFHIFDRSTSIDLESQNTPPPSPSNNGSNLPEGFSRYRPEDTPLTFAYPTAWGEPTTKNDDGFSERGAGKESDGVHAYLVTFSQNKDIEVAITSSKYLPAKRAARYYDFLQWCIGTNDDKYYRQTLRFTTTAGVDAPSNIVCDEGPLPDVTKINDAIIVQKKTKDTSGTVIGDVYTANLSDATIPVLRVKDAKMTNGDDITQLLNTIAGAPQ